jgi:hypothetical protein
MTDNSKLEKALTGIDERKRRTLIRLGLGAAFVAPIVASFSMDGLTISKVHAASANGSGVTHGGNITHGGNTTNGSDSDF